jgi:hypothetical protein
MNEIYVKEDVSVNRAYMTWNSMLLKGKWVQSQTKHWAALHVPSVAIYSSGIATVELSRLSHDPTANIVTWNLYTLSSTQADWATRSNHFHWTDCTHWVLGYKESTLPFVLQDAVVTNKARPNARCWIESQRVLLRPTSHSRASLDNARSSFNPQWHCQEHSKLSWSKIGLQLDPS